MDLERDLVNYVTNADVEGVMEAIRRGSCVNVPVGFEGKRESSALLESVLLADDLKSFTICQLLLLHGADPNLQISGRSPLLEAISLKRCEVVSLLLDSGADPNATDEEGRTALTAARLTRCQAVVDLLEGTTKELAVKFNKYIFEDISEKEKLVSHHATSFLRNVEDIFFEDITGISSESVKKNENRLVSPEITDVEKIFEEIGFKTPVVGYRNKKETLLVGENELQWKEKVESYLDGADKENLNPSMLNLVSMPANSQKNQPLIDNIGFSTMDSRTSETSYQTCKSSFAASLANSGYMSVAEEYIIQDPEHEVQLVEKRLPSLLNTVLKDEELLSRLEEGLECSNETSTDDVSLGSLTEYSVSRIKRELALFGETPSSTITADTRRTYLLRLKHLRMGLSVPDLLPELGYPSPLYDSLKDISSITKKWQSFWQFEEEMCSMFYNIKKDVAESINYLTRESVCKSSFNYLLLDPRKSQNLPYKVFTWADQELWRTFVDSIFYIGKGSRSRPFHHLYDALKKNADRSCSAKIRRILDIWKEGSGVVVLQVFNNVIAVEGYTREALMIDAMGITNLCNNKPGDYYGPCSQWTTEKRSMLGTFLLYKAFKIFLQDGERQIRPVDLQMSRKKSR